MIDSASESAAFGQTPLHEAGAGLGLPSQEQNKNSVEGPMPDYQADPDLAQIPGLQELLRNASQSQASSVVEKTTHHSPKLNEAFQGGKLRFIAWLKSVFYYLTGKTFLKS